ncbi:hypothetical protein EDD18DRAFT_1350710 [Armillaria luteobubalina]|uniref:Uncharacterized protein n=1 Tax=Armillaria luteobubalina TaxID=153913 RepID=A0AA39Q985_9AGAR|nr:hypothetical protein EDD18DRAFT_1350710 [Armillaria luteobubalina]
MAGSCTMRSMADPHLQSIPDSYFTQSIGPNILLPSFASNQSLFIMMMESIDGMVDIESPYKDNDNCLPALKFLHMLITLDKFDNPLTLHKQASALMMFFRLLNCTSSHPPFLETDWCTPQLATKFTQITLRCLDSKTYTWWYPNKDTFEQATYLLQHTSFTNKMLASFVSNLFEEFSTQTNHRYTLWTFLHLIITKLGSDYKLVCVCHQSLEYLHEPNNLFTSCCVLIHCNDTRTLRHLALLHPEHGSWPGCIQRLEEDYGGRGAWIIAEFKAFIQAGCVGAFGEDHMAPQEENDRPVPEQDPRSTVRDKVQRFITGKFSHRGIESSSNNNRV